MRRMIEMEIGAGSILRDATVADVPAVLALVQGAYRGDSSRRGWTHEAELLAGQRTDAAALTASLDSADDRILLAHDGDVLVGCVQITGVAAGRAYLGMLTVDPLRQAGGLGRALIAAAERTAADVFGATAIEMTVVRQRPELIAYYERRGYRLTGESRPFPYEDERFGQPRVADLAFVVLEKAIG